MEDSNEHPVSDLGRNLRAARLAKGWSLRRLAESAEVSASLISQIENARTNPSVRTLHSLAEALSLPVHALFPGPEAAEIERPATYAEPVGFTSAELRRRHDGLPAVAEAPPRLHGDPILRRADRPRIDLQGGVAWERLTGAAEVGIEFISTEYAVGAQSGAKMSRHAGREFGLVLEGELTVELGFDRYVLGPGDSIVFDSTRPHRLSNSGDTPMRALWVIWE